MRLTIRTAKISTALCYCLASLLGFSSASSEVLAPAGEPRGAVACESRVCSQIGIELLARGVSVLGMHFLVGDLRKSR